MKQETIQQIILENQALLPQIELFQRSFAFEDAGCYVFVGVRQAGKSYLLYQRIQELIRLGHSIEEIVYINFDDERLFQIKAEELDEILKAYRALFDFKPLLFFDEIQNIKGWEHFARRLANQKYEVYITGSNARMLSRDMQTTLGGRYWPVNVYPLSFNEYLNAKGVSLHRNWELTAKAQEVQRHVETYFRFGGFPELPSIVRKRDWLNHIFNKILLGDIITRNGIRNEKSLHLTVRRLAETVKQPTTANRICNLVKSAGVTASPASIGEFLMALMDACLIFQVKNCAAKFAEKESSIKHYFIDNGLLNIFLLDADTSLFENICAIHLHRFFSENELFFYRQNIEVDFVIPNKKLAIQAAYRLDDPDTEEREVMGLIKLSKHIELDKLYIITMYDERVIKTSDAPDIYVIPLWKWLTKEIL